MQSEPDLISGVKIRIFYEIITSHYYTSLLIDLFKILMNSDFFNIFIFQEEVNCNFFVRREGIDEVRILFSWNLLSKTLAKTHNFCIWFINCCKCFAGCYHFIFISSIQCDHSTPFRALSDLGLWHDGVDKLVYLIFLFVLEFPFLYLNLQFLYLNLSFFYLNFSTQISIFLLGFLTLYSNLPFL